MGRRGRAWLLTAPMLAFLAGIVAAAGAQRAAAAPAVSAPAPGAEQAQEAIHCRTREPIRFDFVSFAALEQQAREAGAGGPQVARPLH